MGKSKGDSAVLEPEQKNGTARKVLVDPAALTTVPPSTPPEVDPSAFQLKLPEVACFSGYATGNINFDATPRQAAAAKILWCSLAEAGVRVSGSRSSHPNGKVVDGVNDGIRYILDQLADHFEKSTGKDLVTGFDLQFR